MRKPDRKEVKKKADQVRTLIDLKHSPLNTVILKGVLWIRLTYQKILL